MEEAKRLEEMRSYRNRSARSSVGEGKRLRTDEIDCCSVYSLCCLINDSKLRIEGCVPVEHAPLKATTEPTLADVLCHPRLLPPLQHPEMHPGHTLEYLQILDVDM